MKNDRQMSCLKIIFISLIGVRSQGDVSTIRYRDPSCLFGYYS